MTRSVIGPNAALRYLKAYHDHVKYWHEVNPTVLLGYVDKKEHTPFIEEYADEFKNSLVVARIKHPLDGGFHLAPTGKDDYREYVASPEDYHNDFGFLGQKSNIILNVMNEPAGDADDVTIYRLVRWMTEYIPIAVRNKTKSLLFNWADRNPMIVNGMMDGRFDTVLQLMAMYPDLFFMGMHFYGPDDIALHIESYVKRCKDKLGITPPRVIGSEFGLDSTGGVKRGYKTWGWGGGQYAAWQISQVQHELAPYFESGVLIGLTNFQEGNSGGWDDMDTENDSGYKDEIKRAALAGELEPVTKPVTKPFLTPIPKPTDAGSAIKIRVKNAEINVRSGPSTDYTKADILSAGDEITLYQTPFKQDKSGGVWRWVDISTALGGWVCTDVLSYVDITPPPVILPPPTPPVTTYTVTLTAEEYAAWLAFRAAMERAAVQTLSVKVDAAA